MGVCRGLFLKLVKLLLYQPQLLLQQRDLGIFTPSGLSVRSRSNRRCKQADCNNNYRSCPGQVSPHQCELLACTPDEASSFRGPLDHRIEGHANAFFSASIVFVYRAGQCMDAK